MEFNYFEGMLVDHPKRPTWGPGKVVRVRDHKVCVFWRDRDKLEAMTLDMTVAKAPLVVAASQNDPILDNLPPFDEVKGKMRLPGTHRVTQATARSIFAKLFPEGFSDPEFLKNERDYKVAGHEKWVELLGDNQFQQLLKAGETAELSARLLSIGGSVNLISSYENMALSYALKQEGPAKQYQRALLTLVKKQQPGHADYAKYLDAVSDLPRKGKKGARVATWPIATLLPFVARPDVHMLLRPEVTRKSAESLGFDLMYDAQLNATTYEQLIHLGNLWLDQISDLGPRDLIDVQSFIFITCADPNKA